MGGVYGLFSQLDRARRRWLSGEEGPANLAAAMTPRTALVMCESPTNPLMRVCPLRALADVAHQRGALFSVDTTLMTWLLVRLLELSWLAVLRRSVWAWLLVRLLGLSS